MPRSEDGTPAARRPPPRHPPTRAERGGPWGDALRDRLRALRDAERLSQRAFAARAGVTPSRVAEWLSGAQLPSAESLKQLADAFGVCLNWLVCGEGGAETVYRGQSRPRADLERNVAQHVARELAARVGRAGPVPRRPDMLRVDGARVLDACVEQGLGEFRPWLASVLEWMTRGLHGLEAEFYAATFKAVIKTEAAGATDDAARDLVGAIDRHLAAAGDVEPTDAGAPPEGAALTAAAAHEIFAALQRRRLVGERAREFESALARFWDLPDEECQLPEAMRRARAETEPTA